MRKNLGQQYQAYTSRNIEHISINLSKKLDDLYDENNCTLKKETEEDTRKHEYIPLSSTVRNKILKMSILPVLIHRVNTIPIKMPIASFMELEN